MPKNVREWTFTLPSELPFWELEYRWIPKFSESNCKGQKPLDWKVSYIIENLLELRCPKWACMTHLNTSNTSYGQKKGWKSNWQFDSRPLKVGNRPNFLVWKWRATYCWKALNKGYNFFKPHFNRRFAHKVMGPQSYENPNFRNFETPTWESRDKMTFGCYTRGQA
jgi:hypothetical protein